MSTLVTNLAWLYELVPPERRRVLTFLLVGGTGIGTNLLGVLAFRSLGDSAASVAGASVGVISNFALHCRLTFRDRIAQRSGFLSQLRLFAEFCMSSAVAVVAQLLAARELRSLDVHPAVAQFVGILCGTVINFAAQNWVVFRPPSRRPHRDASKDEALHAV